MCTPSTWMVHGATLLTAAKQRPISHQIYQTLKWQGSKKNKFKVQRLSVLNHTSEEYL